MAKQKAELLAGPKTEELFHPDDFTLLNLMSMSMLVTNWQNERPPIQALDSDIRKVMWHFIEEVFEALAEHERFGIETNDPTKLQVEIEDAIFFLFSLATNLGIELDFYDVRDRVNGQYDSRIYERLAEDAGSVSRRPQLKKELEHLLTHALSLLFNVANQNPLETMQQLIVKNSHNYPAHLLNGRDPDTQELLSTDEMIAQHNHTYRCLRMIRDFEEWRARVTGQNYDYLQIEHWSRYQRQIADFRHADEGYQYIKEQLAGQRQAIMTGGRLIGETALQPDVEVSPAQDEYRLEVFSESEREMHQLNEVIEGQNEARPYWAENNTQLNLAAYILQESEELVEAAEQVFATDELSPEHLSDPQHKKFNHFYKVGGELADVIYYLIKYCRRVGYKFREVNLNSNYADIDDPLKAAQTVAALAEDFAGSKEVDIERMSGEVRQTVFNLFSVLFHSCHLLGLDPKEIVLYKIIRNECKYPAELIAMFGDGPRSIDLAGEGYVGYRGACRMAWENVGRFFGGNGSSGDEWFANLFETKMSYLLEEDASYQDMVSVAKDIWQQEIDSNRFLQLQYQRPMELLEQQGE